MADSWWLNIRRYLPVEHNSQQRVVIAWHQPADIIDNWFSGISQLPYKTTLILSNTIDHAVPIKKSRLLLGSEYECVLFDARESLDLDAMGAVSGVLKGGGCLLLVLPDKEKWQTLNSNFYNHVRNLLKSEPGIFYLSETENTDIDPGFYPQITLPRKKYYPCLTEDQFNAVKTCFSLFNKSNTMCGVVVSARGRGKSSLLGLLVARLIQDKPGKIIITAPRRSTAEPFFQHLGAQCSQGELQQSCFKFNQSEVRFVAPDSLLDELPEADLLLVDEAAAIPLSILAIYLNHYNKLIFSTTTHGYEGTGRGFVLKFYKLLDRKRAGWKKIELQQPVRWQQNDWFEQWIEKLLFLNLQLEDRSRIEVDIHKCYVEQIETASLIEDRQKLESVFSLLVMAHYRTSPADFAYILDDEAVRMYTLNFQKMVIGIVVVNQEGGFDDVLSTEIYRGRRRPQGHLLAQTLCFHAGYEQAAQLNYARIMRIAIHPEMQRTGFGRFLLNAVIEIESQKNVDVIGTSFSAETDLLHFWQNAGLLILRAGFSRDHVTASNSVVLAMGVSAAGHSLVNVLSKKFGRNIELWLDAFLQQLPEELKKYFSRQKLQSESPQLNADDMADLYSFSKFYRNYEACFPAVYRLLCFYNVLPDTFEPAEKNLLEACKTYKNNWQEITARCFCSGKTEAIKKLRLAVSHLLEDYQKLK